MFLLKTIRKIFSLLRSGLSAHEIALGFCLGVLGGCIPLSSIWAVAALLLVMVILRTSFTSFFVAMVLGKVLSPITVPICYSLGGVALDGFLSGLFQAIVNTPVLALLDLHRYVIAGGLIFTILVSVAAYPLIYFIIVKYRSSVVRWSEKSSGFQKFTRFGPVRLITWVFFGKKGEFEKTLTTRKSPIRKGAVILLVSFAVVAWLFSFLLGNTLTRIGMEKGMAAAFGADVAIEKASLSFFKGSLELNELWIRDQEEKGDISKARLLRGDLDAAELWRRHFVFDEIAIEGMVLRAARDEQGRFNLDLGEKRREKKEMEKEEKEEKEEPFGVSHLGDIWDKRELGRDIVEKVVAWLFPERSPEAETARREKEKRDLEEQKRYRDIYAEHLLGQERPSVVINNLRITGLDLFLEDKGAGEEPDLFTGLSLRAENLSSNPLLYGKDSVIRLFTESEGAAGEAFHLELTLKWSSPDPAHHLEVRLNDIPAERTAGHMNEGGSVVVEGGTIRLDSETELKPDGFTSKSGFLLQNLALAPRRPGKKILGVDGESFCRALTETMKDAPLALRVDMIGAYTSPRLSINEKELLTAVAEGAKKAGTRIVKEKADEKKKELEDKAQEKIDEGKKKLEDKLDEKLDRLFGRKKKK